MGKNKSGIRQGDAKAKGPGLNKFIARFLQEAAKDFSAYDQIRPQAEPMVYGFNLTMSQNGQPKFEIFGNLDPKNKTQLQQKQKNITHDHLVDIIEKGNQIIVIAEMPGLLKEDLTIKANETDVILETVGAEGKKFRRTILLPKIVDPDTANAQLNNGVLEVTFNKPIPTNSSARLNAN